MACWRSYLCRIASLEAVISDSPELTSTLEVSIGLMLRACLLSVSMMFGDSLCTLFDVFGKGNYEVEPIVGVNKKVCQGTTFSTSREPRLR